jgi:ribosomal protein S18 acetylase RimI-like enzyme
VPFIGLIEVSLERSTGDFVPPLRQWGRDNRNPFAKDMCPHICNLCVSADYRRAGVGTILMSLAEDLMMNHWKKDKIFLHVEQSNYAARAMYAKLGYVESPMSYNWWQRKMMGLDNINYLSKSLQ